MSQFREYIVLNRMFVGDYCSTNMGHEIINIFQADNGQFYVYLNATGGFASDKKDKVKYVILTRNCSRTNTVQVIGKAEVVEDVYSPSANVNQKNICLENNICYGGVNVVDIFSSNTLSQDIYVTFRVDKIVETASDLFISFDKGKSNEQTIFLNVAGVDEVKMAKASLKQYFDANETPTAYAELISALENDALWKKEPVSKVEIEEGQSSKKDNFFQICGIQNSELAFSNAFAYLAKKYPRQFCEFAKKLLGVYISEDFSIYREKWNIDILVADEKNVVVLENKVLSHINGMWFSRKSEQESSQLAKYFEILTNPSKIDKDLGYNVNNEYKSHTKYFYILAPDHNNIELKNYECGDLYTIIKYSQIRNFLLDFKHNAFVEQLLFAMEPHCEKSLDFFQDMKNNFFAKCNETKRLKTK